MLVKLSCLKTKIQACENKKYGTATGSIAFELVVGCWKSKLIHNVVKLLFLDIFKEPCTPNQKFFLKI